jgi:hypothetical protein
VDAKLLAVGSDGLVFVYDLVADKKLTYELAGRHSILSWDGVVLTVNFNLGFRLKTPKAHAITFGQWPLVWMENTSFLAQKIN